MDVKFMLVVREILRLNMEIEVERETLAQAVNELQKLEAEVAVRERNKRMLENQILDFVQRRDDFKRMYVRSDLKKRGMRLVFQVRAKDLEISGYAEAISRCELEFVAATGDLEMSRRRVSTLGGELTKLRETRKNLLQALLDPDSDQ